MLVYVDDIILIGNNTDFITNLVASLGTEFALKDPGALHYFLGIKVQNAPNAYHITQTKYTRHILKKAKI